MAGEAQRGVASVEVAGAVLQALQVSGEPLRLRELAHATGLSASRLHHYLVSLLRIGLVRRQDGSAGYAIGPFAMELGLVAADNVPEQHASAPWLRRLSAETGESSFFAVPSPRGMLIVRWEQGSRPLTVHARLGTVMPILRSATGLAWLAHDPAASEATFAGELRRLAPNVRREVRAARLAEAADVRRLGLAAARGTLIGNVHALAHALTDRAGTFVGAMTVLGLGHDFDTRPRGRLARHLRRCAAGFGARLR